MITAEHAQQMILDLYNHDSDENHVIHYCQISPNQDYWIIRCNTEKSIVYQQFEHLLVGVNAHLVNTQTGEVEVVGSAQDIDDYLQDKYDLREAGNQSYVLILAFDRHNKTTLVNLRQHLQCGYADIILLFSTNPQPGLTSSRRHLQVIQTCLASLDIQSEITLISPPIQAMVIDAIIWHSQHTTQLLLDYIEFIKQSRKVD